MLEYLCCSKPLNHLNVADEDASLLYWRHEMTYFSKSKGAKVTQDNQVNKIYKSRQICMCEA